LNPPTHQRAADAARSPLDRVDHFLAQFVFSRRVSKTGPVTIMNNGSGVGRKHARQDVTVHFDAPTRQGVIEDDSGHVIERHDTHEITTGICSMTSRLMENPNRICLM
jgi:hypothetical protein